jgi:carbamoyltransferase
MSDVVLPRRDEMEAEEYRLLGIDKLNGQRSDTPAVTHVDYSVCIEPS